MIKRALLVVIVLGAALATFGYIAYRGNVAPTVPAVSAEEAAKTGKPYVVKLHAQWCPVCMLTKDVWSQIEKTYSGRVNLVVLDFTNDANSEASRAEATRLGLEQFFDEYSGATGTIVVLDGRTREVTASINGSRDFADYRTAIDAALRSHE
jgi:thiol-disulfide isomerase/thioredoxin